MATEEMRGIPFDSRKQLAEDGSTYEDREVFSADIAEYFGYLSSNGICIREGESLNNQLKITAGTSGTVIFNPGAIKIQGRMGWMENAVEKQAEAGGTKPRYDTAVIELNLSTAERRFIPKIIKGEESDTPTPPELTQTANIYQLGLANIYRTANSTALGTIKDTRADASRCGISKVAVPNVPDDVINLWASQYPGVVSLSDILTKISTEGLPVPFGGTGATSPVAALEALGGVRIEKVWNNSSPESDFGAQTLTLDLSDGEFVDIDVDFPGYVQCRVQRFKIGEKGLMTSNNDNVKYTNYCYTRLIEVKTTGITFKDAYFNNTKSNKYVKPRSIYIVKGVL